MKGLLFGTIPQKQLMKAVPKTFQLDKQAKSLLSKGITSPMPSTLAPMLATLVTEPVEGEDWVYEMKWDGYRATAYLNEGKVEIQSRNNKSFNDKFY